MSSAVNTPLGPVMLDIAGTSLNREDRELITHPVVGGLILFSRNYENKAQLTALIESVRALRPNIIIAVDHEGGRVQRFREEFTHIPPMQKLGNVFAQDNALGLDYAERLGWLLAAELLAMDIDISFAPVLDIDETTSDIIGDRAFSNNPDWVCQLAAKFIQGMRNAGMACTGKHFPGHGGVKEDSHIDLPVDKRTFSDLNERDMLPYRQLDFSLDGIMPAHIVYPHIDDCPVGFSPHWLQQILRQDLGFKGVIFSDDLSMEGAACMGNFAQRSTKALNAGCDVVLICNNREGANAIIASLEETHYPKGVLDKMRASRRLNYQDILTSPIYAKAQEAVANIKQNF